MAGGYGVEQALGGHQLIAFLREIAPRVGRVASICTGALILAEAGLLDGRRATTHWGAIHLLQRYPRVSVEADLLYVRDGTIWTSAGVTAGMDLTLALVREDLGHAVALQAAQVLVLFMMRPGGQAQFSAHLLAQAAENGRLKDMPTWIVNHLNEELPVPRLAERAGMSERTFARVFHTELGMTPARFVEVARVEAARRLLQESDLPSKWIGCRLASATTRRCVGVPPPPQGIRPITGPLPINCREGLRLKEEREIVLAGSSSPPPTSNEPDAKQVKASRT